MTRLTVDYDRHADVLYIALGRPVPDEGEERPQGVILRFALKDGAPTGVTVVGFNHNHWPSRLLELSLLVSQHLHVDPIEVDRALGKLLK